MLKVPFHKPYIDEREIEKVSEVLKKGWLTYGQTSVEFEKKFASFVNAPYAVAVNSCTACLHLALRAIGLTSKDEVIVPTTTFVATAEVVRYFGAKPIFVDIERDTHLIDVSKIEEAITPRTKAIIPVHFSGQPADLDEIKALADRYGLYVIEDAAHALPATYKGKTIGSIGDITCFSFYATKTLATGEGGMGTTANEEFAEKMQILRLHGISKDAWKRYSDRGHWYYDVVDLGYKYNITDIQSALGLVQLEKQGEMLEKRKHIAERYNRAFEEREELITYRVKSDRTTAWHLYPLKLNLESLKIDRDTFIELLKERGIGTSVHFIPLYRFTYYKNLGYSGENYPNSEWVFEREISLPIYPGMTDKEVDYVIETVIDLVKKYRR